MAGRNFTFDPGNAAKVVDFVGRKATPTVYTQNPPAGTPLTEGMVVEVRVASLSDVPIKVLNPDILEAIQEVPVQVLNEIFEADPDLRALGAAPSLPDSDKTVFAEKINAGLAGKGFGVAITADKVGGLAKDLKNVGFFRLGG